VNGEDSCLDDLKAVLLLMEAALPVGSVDDEPEDKFAPLKIRKSDRNTWVSNVQKATSPIQVRRRRRGEGCHFWCSDLVGLFNDAVVPSSSQLMELLILLEHSIHLTWQRREDKKREVYNRIMPNYTMALKYCTVQSVAMRLWALDELINYALIDPTGTIREKLKKAKVGGASAILASHLSPPVAESGRPPRSGSGSRKRRR